MTFGSAPVSSINSVARRSCGDSKITRGIRSLMVDFKLAIRCSLFPRFVLSFGPVLLVPPVAVRSWAGGSIRFPNSSCLYAGVYCIRGCRAPASCSSGRIVPKRRGGGLCYRVPTSFAVVRVFVSARSHRGVSRNAVCVCSYRGASRNAGGAARNASLERA